MSFQGDVIDRKKLVVVPGAEGLAWTIYVDLVSFGPTDACLLDVCSWAVRAALARTKIPKITPVRSALLNKPDFTVEGGEAAEKKEREGFFFFFFTVKKTRFG